jgi:hypothetical protein
LAAGKAFVQDVLHSIPGIFYRAKDVIGIREEYGLIVYQR